MVVFLKEVYDRVRSDKFILSQQPAMKHTWNTMVATLFQDIRLSIACAATDAVLHGNILNLPVMAQQPHPDPNYATAAARLVAAT
jgi:hypothetical protein